MFGWFRAVRARQRAKRRERDVLVKIVALLREDDRQMRRALVRAMCGTIDPDSVWVIGQRYRCHQCGRMYKRDRRCIWGLCRRCS